MKLVIKLFTIGLLLSTGLLVATILRTVIYFPAPTQVATCADLHQPIDGQSVIDRFRSALQFKTITKAAHDYDTVELKKYIDFIIKNYPAIHSSKFVSYELVNNLSLLYTIQGSDPSLTPYLLCGHLDVVTVELDKWDVDPFAGVIRDGFIYGRGTIDVKNIVMAILESFDYLLKNGFKPKRSFFIAFGHDEEALGLDGAQYLAKAIQAKGVDKLEYLLDEGTIIMNQTFPGVQALVAMVGVTEKGYLTVRLDAKGQVGHSSMAPKETAITTLAKAVSKFESTVHPNMFGSGPEKDLFEAFAPYASFPYNWIYSNLWLFGPIFSRILSTKPSSNGLVRTTSAATIIGGGYKENVCPSSAVAYINHRIHVKQTIEEIVDFDRRLISDDRIALSIHGLPIHPHPISPYDDQSFGYQTIRRSIRQVFNNTAVVPGIMLANTDTRWYKHLTSAIYRFSPSILYTEDTVRFHGHNERISVDNYMKTVNYYHHIIVNSDLKDLADKPLVKDEL
ncbi:N-fatty-acyl-amino acid synthase/hydrolase PM20D1-like [Oppia nitens]|uniref:N-fatty-acyl-amino acid synthase/hydrolase PM20D1-like n=1 Tax=Oppia nitens TaxID=1686743 RepID=UPI0023DACDF3|nr:N-fatty-acyl-amino acid synthase/hydrolase PM20D1-like [Oppia nitens]XP_054168835.1 N-fatty-acyl-amino acid synthase/hydrolase PM20D1-like [Oppia nitens]